MGNKLRPLYEIASDIKKDWSNVNFAAKPYLDAMLVLNSVDDKYGLEDGEMIVAYFLANASTWKGGKAREIKKELNRMI